MLESTSPATSTAQKVTRWSGRSTRPGGASLAALCALSSSASALLLPAQVHPLPDTPRRAIMPHVEFRDFALSLSVLSLPGTTLGTRVLVRIPEDEMGTDLNHDGDALDLVLHGVDVTTGATVNLALASLADSAFDPARQDHAVVQVSEISQGQDLNGDGDQGDAVLFALDLVAGSARSSGLAVSTSDAALVDGPWAALSVNEAGQGAVDLNGDGVVGKALFVWDLTGTDDPLDTGLGLGTLEAAHESFFLFTVDESAQGVDRNDDGDANDFVLHAFHAETGAVANTHFAAGAIAEGLHSVLFVSEGSQGADLDGDGDLQDTVPHAFSLATGEFVNMQVALSTPIVDIGHGGQRTARSHALSEEGVAFHVSEAKQGGVDLNGDGDSLDEDILFVHVFATGETRNLGLSVWDFELTGELLAMQVGEYSGGLEARVHDLAENTTWDLGVPSSHAVSQSSFVIRGNWVALTADEAGIDHTGDGQGNDRYLVLADARRRRLVDTGLALAQANYLEWSLVFNDSGALTALAYEPAMAADLNGDGDTSDQVVQILYPAFGLELNTGASGSALLPGYRQTYPLTTLEEDDAVDHNGDGDALDIVLRTVRLKLR